MSLWISTGIVLLYAIFSGWDAHVTGRTMSLLSSGVSFAVFVCLCLRKPWSRFLVDALAITVFISWSIPMYWIIAQGDWPYPNAFQTVISLLPAIALFGLWATAAILAHRYFRRRETEASRG